MINFSKFGLIAACSVSPLFTSQTILANDLTEIVVTAKGNQSLTDVLPTSHIYTAEDIAKAQAQDLPSLLDEIGGISATPTGGRGSVTGLFLRGTALSQSVILIDGVRIGSASLGQATINAYPLEAIERIEVVKGPLSGIYGADAVGGVIQIFTKSKIDGLGSANVTVGNDNLVDYGINLGFGNDDTSFVISGNIEETDGIDATSITAGGNDDLDGFEETALSLSGKIKASDKTSLRLSVLYTDNEAEFDNTFGDDTGFITATKTLSSALSITTAITDSVKWTTNLGSNKDESVTEVFFSDITTNRDVVGTEFEIALSEKNTLTIGGDYYQEQIDTLDDYPVIERDNAGAFALLQSRLGQFSFAGSLRYDNNSAYGADTNSSIAVNYDFSNQLRATLSYGTAFSAPSFNFLYFPFFGNPDLLPEESESIELTLRGQVRDSYWRVSAYQTDVKNLFSFDPESFLAANIGEADIKGLEFELGLEFAQWQISSHLDLLSADDVDTGVELDDRAKRTLSIVTQRNFGALDFRLALKAEQGRFDNRGTELASYGLFDIAVNYQINNKLAIAVNIDNLFDKDYTLNLIGPLEHYNTLGRQGQITLRYQF